MANDLQKAPVLGAPFSGGRQACPKLVYIWFRSEDGGSLDRQKDRSFIWDPATGCFDRSDLLRGLSHSGLEPSDVDVLKIYLKARGITPLYSRSL